MKRIGIVVFMGLCLWVDSVGAQPPAAEPGPRVSPRMGQTPSARRLDGTERELMNLREQLQGLRQQQESLVGQLKEVLQAAQSEQAAATVEKLQAVLRQLNEQYDRQVGVLQRRIQRLERAVAVRNRTGLQVKRVGLPAPSFALKDLDGREVRFSQLKGKIVVLEWISPRSNPVLYHYEHKTLRSVEQRVGAQGVVWLRVASSRQDTDPILRHFVERYEVTGPVLDDRDGRVARAYGVTRTPHVVIIDTEGKIAYTGGLDNDPALGKLKGPQRINYVENALNDLLAGRAVAEPEGLVYGAPL